MVLQISRSMATKVIAVCDISEGTESIPGVGPIDLRRLFENVTPTVIFHAGISDNYLHLTDVHAESEWARYISIAKNCHEQNIEITNSPLGLILRSTRRIKVGEELLVWVGMDLLSKLEFPFLNPLNIKGNQAYYCHRCGSIFKDPNPLKVHLSFQCKNLEISSKELSLTEFPQSKFWDYNTTKIFPDISMKLNESESDIPYISKKNCVLRDQLCYAQPVLQKKCLFINNESKSPRNLNTAEITVQDTKSNEIVLRHSAENLLSSVTNNWKSNGRNSAHVSQGHVCAFCGKVYSRKYGLKIHVRTHTGYKPLKCKYCFRPFSDPSNLNKHVRLHSESDAPYRCSKCGKVLVRRRDLDRHLKSRHPEIEHEK